MNSTSRAGNHLTEEQRRAVVERWRASGLTQAEFCRQEGYTENSLSQWKQQCSLKDAKKQKKVRPLRQTPKSEEEWRRLFAAFAQSKESDVDFCRPRGINVMRFRRFKKILAASVDAKETQRGNPFVQVTLDQQHCRTDSTLEIILPGGSRIVVTEQSPLPLLARVLQLMEAKC